MGRSDGSTKAIFEAAKQQTIALNADGFRVLAVAYKDMDPSKTAYSIEDESAT